MIPQYEINLDHVKHKKNNNNSFHKFLKLLLHWAIER